MAVVEWDDSFSVGITAIDNQHRDLMGLIANLNNALAQGIDRETLSNTVQGLIDYATAHFAVEEEYFDRFAYPRAPSHKREHRAFARRVSDLQRELSESRVGLGIEVMFFLSDWLRNHIQGSDKQYAAYFKARNITSPTAATNSGTSSQFMDRQTGGDKAGVTSLLGLS